MILKGLEVKKAIIIKTKSDVLMEDISKMIHKQLIGKKDYIDSKIILSLGDGSNNEIPENEIHLYIFNDCELNPIIAIGKFPIFREVIIDISVISENEELEVIKDINYQLWNNQDYLDNNIILNSSFDRQDTEVNGYCARVIYNCTRKSTPSLIL